MASDGRWYPPELWTGPPTVGPAGAPAQSVPTYPAQPTSPVHGPASGAGPAYGSYGYGQYPPQGVGAPYGQPVRQKTNGLAVAALICGCAGLFFLPAILGVIFGFIARSQIKRSNGAQRGDGMAIAGIIVAIGWLALLVLAIALGHSTNTNNNNGTVDPSLLLGQLGLGGFN